MPGRSDASSRPDRFRLDGPSRPLDPRTHAFRNDIADVALAGCWFAPHYVEPEPRACAARSATVRTGPAEQAPAATQLLHGERFDVLDVVGGWAWGRCGHDDYVGYVADAALGPVTIATHRVIAPLALTFADADIKAPVLGRWPIGARLAGVERGAFLATGSGFVHLRHVAPVGVTVAEPIVTAERLIGAPYRWGGRGADGIDCSGLVQVALGFAGIAAPRDSDQQRDTLGDELAADAALARGDIVFFPGHVGLMADGDTLVHANAHWMAVTSEPLADVVARLQLTHAAPITARRRITR